MTIKKNALPITRKENFSEWYHAVIIGAELADRADVRGCMVIKPYGFAIWEKIKNLLDTELKKYKIQNCYFPLFIPIEMFEKEAEHIAGFAKEIAVVTHSRLEMVNGKLVPSSKLEQPLAVRPTSEMIIGESFSRWIKSYRDLPICVNQWCNVVRWEMRPRMFLRTMEFLWHEGHTAHATEEEAKTMAMSMHNVYYNFVNKSLLLTCFAGKKPRHEKFPGAVDTYTIECMMQDGKALQMCTSHYLGQNFAKSMNIRFQNTSGELEFAYTTSFGATTRLIGAIIMCHGDDNGLNLPTKIAPYHAVILPVIRNNADKEKILNYCQTIINKIKSDNIIIDNTDYSVAEKKWNYIRKGVPIICEIGKRELENFSVCYTTRQPEIENHNCGLDAFLDQYNNLLQIHDKSLAEKHKNNTENNIHSVSNLEEIQKYFANNTGFVIAPWNEDETTLSKLDELSITIRCAINQSNFTNIKQYIFAKSY